MNTQEFTDWLHQLAENVLAGSASVALVTIEDDTASIAAAGDDADTAMANLLIVAKSYQESLALPPGTLVN